MSALAHQESRIDGVISATGMHVRAPILPPHVTGCEKLAVKRAGRSSIRAEVRWRVSFHSKIFFFRMHAKSRGKHFRQ